VDFEHAYRTMDLPYMESVMWAFRRLYELGLVYESYRVMPYSWAAETPLSNFELRLDNAYRSRRDPAVTVKFVLQPESGDDGQLSLWAWTTTPWTLPANLALAVGEEAEYAIYERDKERWLLAVEAEPRYQAEISGARRVGTRHGRDLVGRSYAPPFPFFRAHDRAFRVLAAQFVDTLSGTGVVHLAPGFGEDDQRACEQAGIDLVCPVDDRGRFTDQVGEFAGMNVFQANPRVVERLRQAGLLVRHELYEHAYPHCWRTDEPVIYRALRSWYVRVTAFKDRMLELNRQIRWVPEHVQDGQFGSWLENARDWAVSRNRFWGAPLPVWKSDNPDYPRVDVYGSLAELERDFGTRPRSLHRPFVDALTRPNPDDPTGKSMMRRVPEVFDCWFESGAMPFAAVHYPFENKAWFEAHFPADFVVEYVSQTRGWFYTLTVLAAALFNRPAFQNCVCHGVVLDTEGRKLSKKLGNYPDPLELCELHGSDALRWFLMSSPVLRGANVVLDEAVSGDASCRKLERVSVSGMVVGLHLERA
jgi:isoleucyl-tRNA synthetase